ncbi:type II toxin-antitoxin system RelE family toxin [Pelotomaculum propionicicum]|uniref:Uncharacterized protein n=1 Tax=Pelotomaculum propionicicum TaxID=258475 RepID=A0A4Y7RPP2_9FIRM|nr:type II toxin-antitoxin system RelE/ParE family toxin [Pelotomaculum propionicicum]TEB10766.1 hypothetical protein Pmgp_02081 [Pelotomaculum propionicicum]
MWKVEYLRNALEDIKQLDRAQRVQFIKAINKVSGNPLPQAEGGYGKPLGNKGGTNLAGYFKIKLLIVPARADDEVYIITQRLKGCHSGNRLAFV